MISTADLLGGDAAQRMEAERRLAIAPGAQRFLDAVPADLKGLGADELGELARGLGIAVDTQELYVRDGYELQGVDGMATLRAEGRRVLGAYLEALAA